MFKKLTKIPVYLIIALLTVSSACQIKVPGLQRNSIIIPLDFSTQRPVLELMINNNGPYRFIFDTGSSGNVISDEIANELSFKVIGVDTMFTPGSANKLMSNRVSVPKVSFANTNISEDAIMSTIPSGRIPVDGIISTAFFSKYLIKIDYPGSQLILSIGELDSTSKDVTPFIQDPRIINLDVYVDGHKVEAHLDSGNPGGFALPFSLKDKLKFKVEPYEAGVVQTPVASFKRWKATLSGDIKIGNFTYKNPEINLIENFKFVNVGYEAFKDLSVTIDKKNNLIKFEKSNTKRVLNSNDEIFGEKNDFTGWYGGHERKIFLEEGEMYLQRGSASKLKLVKIGEDRFEMVINMPVMNELPNIKFERDETNKVIGLVFLFKDGREDFVKKDN